MSKRQFEEFEEETVTTVKDVYNGEFNLVGMTEDGADGKLDLDVIELAYLFSGRHVDSSNINAVFYERYSEEKQDPPTKAEILFHKWYSCLETIFFEDEETGDEADVPDVIADLHKCLPNPIAKNIIDQVQENHRTYQKSGEFPKPEVSVPLDPQDLPMDPKRAKTETDDSKFSVVKGYHFDTSDDNATMKEYETYIKTHRSKEHYMDSLDEVTDAYDKRERGMPRLLHSHEDIMGARKRIMSLLVRYTDVTYDDLLKHIIKKGTDKSYRQHVLRDLFTVAMTTGALIENKGAKEFINAMHRNPETTVEHFEGIATTLVYVPKHIMQSIL